MLLNSDSSRSNSEFSLMETILIEVALLRAVEVELRFEKPSVGTEGKDPGVFLAFLFLFLFFLSFSISSLSN